MYINSCVKDEKLTKKLLFSLLCLILLKGFSQTKFQFYGENNIRQKVNFKLINNLIVMPVAINGKELNFILDSGVNKTILFDLSEKDSLGLNNITPIELKGLGDGASVDALLSKNNDFRIKNLRNPRGQLYIILRDQFRISSRMGVTIHGIIGFDLLKNVIVKIDYKNKVLTFYNPKKYKLKKCKKCEKFDLEFFRNKPYLNTITQFDTISNVKVPTKLLIDSGGSDALWYFEGTHEEIETPKKFFKDVLGEGLSGTIYGNRSRVPEFNIGSFVIEKPTVSFLDTVSTVNARQFKERNGSVGGNILKRFTVWFDYPNRKFMLKKTGSLKGDFYYNMSGLSIVYNGQELVREERENLAVAGYGVSNKSGGDKVINFITSYYYEFKPSYRIDHVLEGSPAFEVGLEKDDIIKKINGREAHSFTLDEIMELFQRRPDKKITLEVERLGLKYKFKFKLKQRI